MNTLPVGYSAIASCSYTVIDNVDFSTALVYFADYNATHKMAQFAVEVTIIAGDTNIRGLQSQCSTSTQNWAPDQRLCMFFLLSYFV
jgi:hypothetical protein